MIGRRPYWPGTHESSKQSIKTNTSDNRQVGRDCTSRRRDRRTLMTPVSVTQLATKCQKSKALSGCTGTGVLGNVMRTVRADICITAEMRLKDYRKTTAGQPLASSSIASGIGMFGYPGVSEFLC